MAVVSRAVFLPREGASGAQRSDVLVLDLERHTSLVTPVGASLDGALGLRPPRRQDLWALYSVTDGCIDSIWLTPAAAPAAAGGSGAGEATAAAPAPAGEAALDALRGDARAWGAFCALVERQLGAGYSLLTSPLCTARVGRCELQGRRRLQGE